MKKSCQILVLTKIYFITISYVSFCILLPAVRTPLNLSALMRGQWADRFYGLTRCPRSSLRPPTGNRRPLLNGGVKTNIWGIGEVGQAGRRVRLPAANEARSGAIEAVFDLNIGMQAVLHRAGHGGPFQHFELFITERGGQAEVQH